MSENAKKPRIRFKGFADAWEQRKVSDLLVERNTQAPKSEEYPLMAFIGNEGVVEKGERYNRESLVSDSENKKYKRTEKGDFIYSSNNLETGSIGLNQYGNASISPVYSIFYPTEIADYNFLGRRLVRKDFINQMVKWRQGVIYGQWRIHEDDFLKIEIFAPQKREQEKIGDIFKYLDSLITLHQRKYDKLVDVKKSLLEKMFPQGDENTPKIRFKGFTETWEQREFGEIANRTTEISTDTCYPCVEYEDIISGRGVLNKDVFKKKIHKAGIVFHSGDILYGKLRPYLHNWYLASFSGLAVGDFWVLQAEKVENTFLYRLIQSRIFDEIANQSTGTKMPRADWKLVSKMKFGIPLQKEEQGKIGLLFIEIDKLITLHQRKLEKLKNVKSALLEKMFV